MKAIQVVFDEALLALVDRFAKAADVSRSAFIRQRMADSLRGGIRLKCEAEAIAYGKKPAGAADAKVSRAFAASQRALLEADDGEW